MSLYKFRLGVMLALKRSGFLVYAIAPEDVYSQKLRAHGIGFLPLSLNANQTNPLKDVTFFFKLVDLYRQIQPDLAVHYTVKPNIYGSLAAKWLGIPSLSVVPGRGHSFHKKNWLFLLVKLLYMLSQKFSVGTWFLNQEDRDFFITEGIVESNKTLILPGEGVDTSYYKPKSSGKSNKINNGCRFLLIGRLLWEKGVGVYAEAAKLALKKYPDVKFFLLGYLDENDHRVVPLDIIQAWEKEGVLEYLGSAEDVRSLLGDTDCFVLPSFYGEGLPRSLMEAASMAIPIITTDSRGCREAVEDGVNGYLCRPENVHDLADKMLKFIALSEKERQEMGKKGRERMVAKFQESFVVSIYLHKIGELLQINLSNGPNEKNKIQKELVH